LRHETAKGASSITSYTHRVITNVGDLDGSALIDIKPGEEILSCWKEKQGKKVVWRVYQDRLAEVKDVGVASVVEITLEKEYIYWTGETQDCGTLAHNRKPAPGID
jgi:hypothetical protein